MAWRKVTPDEVAQFHAALPDDPRIVRVKMFGMSLGRVGGNHFAGVGPAGVMVRVSEPDQQAVLASGGTFWEPMPGRPRPDLVVLPASASQDPATLARWVRRAFEHGLTLPPRAAKKPKAKRAVTRRVATKSAAEKKAPARKAAKTKTAKKPAKARAKRRK